MDASSPRTRTHVPTHYYDARFSCVGPASAMHAARSQFLLFVSEIALQRVIANSNTTVGKTLSLTATTKNAEDAV